MAPAAVLLLLLAALSAPQEAAARNFASWTQAAAPDGNTRPEGLCDFSLAFDYQTRELLLWNGDESDVQLQPSVWRVATNRSAATFTEVSAAPLPRVGSFSLLRNRTRQLFDFGGDVPEGGPNGSLLVFAELYVYNVSQNVWTLVNLTAINGVNRPTPRSWGRMTWLNDDESTIFLMGGIDTSGTEVNDTWLLHVTNFTFEQVPPSGEALRPLSGYCMDRAGSSIFVLGGYNCTLDFDTDRGGRSCFNDRMYVFNITARSWSSIARDDASGLWPPSTFYASCTVYSNRWWVFGGSSIDATSVKYFFDTLHVFNFTSRLFEPVTVLGRPPTARWSHSATTATAGPGYPRGEMWLVDGCSGGDTYYRDVHALLYDRRVEPENCEVFGPGKSNANAGEEAVFYVQTREVGQGGGFGENITWGTGLDFEAVLVAQEACGVNQADVTELGDGLYSFTYTVLGGGAQVRAFVYLVDSDEKRLVAGAPFNISLSPAAPDGTASVAVGLGTLEAARGERASVTVRLADSYGNLVRTGNYAANISARIDGQPVPVTVVGFGNGTYVLEYVAPSRGSYLLDVQVDGQSVSGSPFTISTLPGLRVTDGAYIFVCVLSAVGCIIVLALAVALFLKYREQSVKAGSPRLFPLVFVGCWLGLASLFIGPEPTDDGCLAQIWLLGVSFMCVVPVLAMKNWRIMRIFNANLNDRPAVTDVVLLVPIGLLLVLEVTILAAWTGTDRVRSKEVSSARSEFQRYRECDSEHYTEWLLGFASYKLALLIYCLHLAVQTRELPKLFNESKGLGLAVYNISVLLILVAPVLYSIRDAPQQIFILRGVFIFWVIIFTAAVLVLPKVLGVFGADDSSSSSRSRRHDNDLQLADHIPRAPKGETLELSPTGVASKSRSHLTFPTASSNFAIATIPEARGGAAPPPQSQSQSQPPSQADPSNP